MTRERIDEHSTEFGLWLRRQHQQMIGSHTYSAQNLDYIWHNYKQNWLITIEEKRYGSRCTFAQRDTHGIVAQMLEMASGTQCRNERGQLVKVEYRGHYVIVFSNTNPEDGAIRINNQPATTDDLLRLLTTGCLAIPENLRLFELADVRI